VIAGTSNNERLCRAAFVAMRGRLQNFAQFVGLGELLSETEPGDKPGLRTFEFERGSIVARLHRTYYGMPARLAANAPVLEESFTVTYAPIMQRSEPDPRTLGEQW
jgi:hypothetical protein